MRELDAVSRVEFTIDWSPGEAYAYLVGGDEPVLVDAGIPDDRGRDELEAGLADAGYGLEDVEHVVLTHPHSDHLGQVPSLGDVGATIHAPRRVCEQLERDADELEAGVRETARAAGLDDDRVDEEVDRALDSLRRNRRLLPPESVDERFDYGETYDVADLSFTPIHTPGHQAYHAAYAVPFAEGDALFSGDVLIESFRAVAMSVGLDDGAYEAFCEFDRALSRLDREYARAFPGHGPIFEDVPAVVEDTRADLRRAMAETERAVGALESGSPLAVTEERYGEVRTPAVFLDTIGALGALEADGVLTHDVVDGVRQYYQQA